MRKIPETAQYFYKIKKYKPDPKANLTLILTPDPNPNPNAIPILHLCNAECVKLWQKLNNTTAK